MTQPIALSYSLLLFLLAAGLPGCLGPSDDDDDATADDDDATADDDDATSDDDDATSDDDDATSDDDDATSDDDDATSDDDDATSDDDDATADDDDATADDDDATADDDDATADDDDATGDDDDTVATNTPPTAPLIGLAPDVAYAGYADLVCQVQFASYDLDGDPLVYDISWTLNAAPWTGATSTTTIAEDTIAAADLVDGDAWECTVEPFDGTDVGPSATAALVVQAAGPWVQLSGAGNSVMCALDDVGEIVCWGYSPSYPWWWESSNLAASEPPAGPWVEVASSNGSGSALDAAGNLVTWGEFVGAPPPAVTYEALAAGAINHCAVKTAGGIACWGESALLQSEAPSSGTWVALDVGSGVACALDDQGAVSCWGDSSQLATVPTTTGLTDIALTADTDGGFFGSYAHHTACVIDAGAITCWGEDGENQATNAPGGSDWVSIHGGTDAASFCALNTIGELECWGSNAGRVVSDAPTGQSGFLDVAPGDSGACATHGSGNTICWGAIGHGLGGISMSGTYVELAVDSESGETIALCAIPTSGGVQCLSALEPELSADAPTTGSFSGLRLVEEGTACALDSQGAVVCWGADDYLLVSTAPTGTGYSELALGRLFACAIQAGTLDCWGTGTGGGLVTDVPTVGIFTSVELSFYSGCAIDVLGQIVCWGDVGLFPFTNPAPTDAGWSGLSSSMGAYCAVDPGGDVQCWGSQNVDPNTSGQVGTATSSPGSVCGIDAVGAIECWDSGSAGYLGVEAPIGSGYSELSADEAGACALDSAGRIGCWGRIYFDMHW